MNRKINRRPLFTLVLYGLLALTNSCDKYHSKKLAGTYTCKVDYHYWDMTPMDFDTTYYEDIDITRDRNDLIILGYRIHIDSLWKEKEFTVGDVHYFMTVLFREDNVYITHHSGGLGGGATRNYNGHKK